MNTEAKIGAKPRNLWIDSLKGFAILGVILSHIDFASGTTSHLVLSLSSGGVRGVQVFLILSAYLGCASYDKRLKAATAPRGVARRWYLSRFLRVAPAYYAALALYLAVFGLAGNPIWLGAESALTLPNIASHFLFLHGVSPYWINSIIGAEWYLFVLAVLYALVPLMVKYIDTARKAAALVCISVPVCAVVSLRVKSLWLGPSMLVWGNFTENFSFFYELPVMLMGVLLFRLRDAAWLRRDRDKRFLSYAVALCSVFCIVVLMLGNVIAPALLSGFAILCLMASQIIWPCKLICNPVMAFLGRHSYGVYLLHLLFLRLLSPLPFALGNKYLDWGAQYLLSLAASLAVTLAVKACVRALKKG